MVSGIQLRRRLRLLRKLVQQPLQWTMHKGGEITLTGTGTLTNLKAAIKRVKNHACMSSVEREQTRYEVSTLTKRAKLERVVVEN